MHYSDSNISASAMADVIAHFSSEARHSKMPPLQISGLDDVSAAMLSSQGRPGVYLFYRADRTLIYIGMSLSNVAGRLGKHMSSAEQASSFWASRTPALVQTVLVDQSWEAPSLEEYLIQQAQMIKAA